MNDKVLTSIEYQEEPMTYKCELCDTNIPVAHPDAAHRIILERRTETLVYYVCERCYWRVIAQLHA